MNRSAPAYVALVAVGAAGGALLVLPLLLAWALLPYAGAALGTGTVDPTWNDGDAGIAAAGLGVAFVLVAGIGLASGAIARGRLRRPAATAVLVAALSVMLALAPVSLLLQPR